MKEIFDWLYTGYGVFTGLVVYLGSYFFALNFLFTLYITSQQNSYLYIVLAGGFVGAILNFILYLTFNNQYHLWGFVKKNKLQRAIFFMPPVTTFIIGASLSAYALHFINSEYNEVWKNTQASLPNIIEALSKQTSFFIALLIFGVAYLFVTYKLFLLMGAAFKNGVVRYAIKIFAAFMGVFLVFTLVAVIDHFIELPNISPVLSVFIYYLLGAIPLYWFYELFLAPIYRNTYRVEEKIEKILKFFRKLNNADFS